MMMRSIAIAIAATPKRFVHRNLKGKGNPPTATSSFNLCGFCCRGRAFSVASDGYREILRNGLRDIKLDDAVGLFSEMVKSRPFPSIVDFSKLLSAIAKLKKYDVVISLGEKMQKLGIPHDLYTYNILINCFCRSSQLPFALSILGKMMKLGYDPSIVTLSSLLNGYCHGNRIFEKWLRQDFLTRREFLSPEGLYATNNQFQKAGPKGFIQVKVLENDSLYIRVDLPGVPDDAIRHRVDSVRQKVIFFSGETPDYGNPKDGVREYSGTAGLGCDCCEITGVDAKMKDGVLRMIVSRVKVKDHESKCILTLPPFTGKSGRYLEDHPFVVKGRKSPFVGAPLPKGGLYFAVDVPGVCPDDVEVLANEDEVRFYAKVKDVYEHDESARVFLGRLISRGGSSSCPLPSLLTNTLGYEVQFGVLKIGIAPPRKDDTTKSE